MSDDEELGPDDDDSWEGASDADEELCTGDEGDDCPCESMAVDEAVVAQKPHANTHACTAASFP